jgi:hypothetical protein
MWFAPIMSRAQANCSRFFLFGSRTRITGVPSALNSVIPDDWLLFPLVFLIRTTPIYITMVRGLMKVLIA